MAMLNITIPIQIITKKIGNIRTNSIFYAGKDIAKVKIGNKEYVLTTAGEYSFMNLWWPEPGTECRIPFPLPLNDVTQKFLDEQSDIVKRLTDKRIERLDLSGFVYNWGWFGINVWENEKCMPTPTEAYSTYDEAMKAFIEYVQAEEGGGH